MIILTVGGGRETVVRIERGYVNASLDSLIAKALRVKIEDLLRAVE